MHSLSFLSARLKTFAFPQSSRVGCGHLHSEPSFSSSLICPMFLFIRFCGRGGGWLPLGGALPFLSLRSWLGSPSERSDLPSKPIHRL